jgi:hypothetical protein
MKSQAETAGRLGDGGGNRPEKGTVLRDVVLLLGDGSRNLLSALRGRSNFVMVFTAGRDERRVLTQLAASRSALEKTAAAVLIISLRGVEHSFPVGFEVALDSDGKVHCELGAVDDKGNAVPAIYVTDRFGELFAAFRQSEQHALPDAKEIVSWLEFINQQCEECSPPEWR